MAMHQCRGYLDDLIAREQPRVLIPLGGVALKRVTGFESIEENHAYVHQTEYGIPAVATFHPSHIIQGAHKLTLPFVLAFERAREIAEGRYVASPIQLWEDPPLSHPLWTERVNPDTPLMLDIETPESTHMNEEEAEDDASYNIVRMGYSLSAGRGVSVPFEGDYIGRLKALVAGQRFLSFWNKNYDLPRILAAGFELHPHVRIIDWMWAWHFYQSDLPKALAFAAPFFYAGPAWKHLSSQRPAYYNAMDNAVQGLCAAGIEQQLRLEGRWERFLRHCVAIEPIYVSMGAAGIKVDKDARTVFMKAMEDDAVAELIKVQELLPESLKRTRLLKRKPKPSTRKMSRMQARANELVRVEEIPTAVQSGEPLSLFDNVLVKPQYLKHIPFNPNSTYDLMDLMHELKVKIPRKRGEDRETTEAKYLKRFTKHPIFRHIVNFKQRSKLLSTYNWPLDDHDRAHTTYGFHPSTWRSSSRNVNLGNIPKRAELAKLFRRLLIAEAGHKLVEIDRSALEAVLVGHWAKSPKYIALAKAGVHSWLLSQVKGAGVPWDLAYTDMPLAKKTLKEFKVKYPVEYEMCKRGVHGFSYLLSPFGLHDEYEEYFPTEFAARELHSTFFNSEPGQEMRAWHEATLKEAWNKRFLDNNFQYRHYFYEIYTWDKRGKAWKPGEDAKRAVAFRPQSDGAAIQREDLLGLQERHGWVVPALRLPTYDSLIAEVPNAQVDQVIEALADQFNRPIPELGGLTIGSAINVGSNLAPMDETNPQGMEEVL